MQLLARGRAHLSVLALLMLAAPLYFALSWSDQLGSLGGDAAVYMLTAYSYAPGSLPDAIADEAAAKSQFPPLYPLLLAWLGGAVDVYAAHQLTTACLLIACLGQYAWLRSSGAGRWAATFAVGIFMLLPWSHLSALLIQSESLYLAFSLWALVALVRYEREGKATDLAAAATMVAAASLTRSIGITLLAPLVLCILRRRRPSDLWAPVLAVLPVALWHLMRDPEISYREIAVLTYAADPYGTLLSQIAREASALRLGFAINVLQTDTLQAVTDGLGLIVLAACVVRVARLRPDGVYVLVYGVLVMLWPFPVEAPRFVWVVMPVLLGQVALLGTHTNSKQVGWSSWVRIVTLGAVLLCVLPSLILTIQRYRAGSPETRIHAEWYQVDPAKSQRDVLAHRAIVESLERISVSVPQNGCVISISPSLIQYYARRRSIKPPTAAVSEHSFDTAVRSSGCRHVFLMALANTAYPEFMYPLSRLQGRLIPIDGASEPTGEPGKSWTFTILAELTG